MKKKFTKAMLAFALIIGSGAAFAISSIDTQACKECDTSNLNRKCKCGSSRLEGTNYSAPNGKTRTKWVCRDCKHSFITEMRNGKDVILTEKELNK